MVKRSSTKNRYTHSQTTGINSMIKNGELSQKMKDTSGKIFHKLRQVVKKYQLPGIDREIVYVFGYVSKIYRKIFEYLNYVHCTQNFFPIYGLLMKK